MVHAVVDVGLLSCWKTAIDFWESAIWNQLNQNESGSWVQHLFNGCPLSLILVSLFLGQSFLFHGLDFVVYLMERDLLVVFGVLVLMIYFSFLKIEVFVSAGLIIFIGIFDSFVESPDFLIAFWGWVIRVVLVLKVLGKIVLVFLRVLLTGNSVGSKIDLARVIVIELLGQLLLLKWHLWLFIILTLFNFIIVLQWPMIKVHPSFWWSSGYFRSPKDEYTVGLFSTVASSPWNVFPWDHIRCSWFSSLFA